MTSLAAVAHLLGAKRGSGGPLVDLGFGCGRTVLQEVEIATLIGLADVLLEHATVAALVARLWRNSRRPAPREFLIGDSEV